MDKKLSIIIPVYNMEKYLGRCIESIQKQTYSNLEIILVNDGSTDNSLNICDTYAKNDERIVVIHKSNGGVSSARNSGLKICTGEYVTFVDPDDELFDTAVYLECVRILERNKIDVVFFGANVNRDGKIIQETKLEDKIIKVNNQIKADTLRKEFPLAGYPWNKVWRKKNIEGMYFDESLFTYEDMKWILCVYDKINYIATSSIIGYTYYVHQNSLSHNRMRNINTALNGIEAYIGIAQYYTDHKEKALLKAAKAMTIYSILMKLVVALKEKDMEMIEAMKACFFDNAFNIFYVKSPKLWIWNFIIIILYKTKYGKKNKNNWKNLYYEEKTQQEKNDKWK